MAIGLWAARIQRTLIIKRGVKRAPSCQEGAPCPSVQSHSWEKRIKAKKKSRKKPEDFGDPVATTDEFYDGLIVLAAVMMFTASSMCKDGSVWSPVDPLLEQLGCSRFATLLVIVMILLRSGDVETNPGPVEGGRCLCLLSSWHE